MTTMKIELYEKLSKEEIERMLYEYGNMFVFDDNLECNTCIGDTTGVPDVFFRSPRNEKGQFIYGN